MTEYFYKLLSIALLVLLLAIGAGWGLAAHDRDQAKANLSTERDVSDQLRGSIREQNLGIEALAAAKSAADARGVLAQQLAVANGKRFDGALARIAGAKATTCAEAMPAVNQLLESMQ